MSIETKKSHWKLTQGRIRKILTIMLSTNIKWMKLEDCREWESDISSNSKTGVIFPRMFKFCWNDKITRIWFATSQLFVAPELPIWNHLQRPCEHQLSILLFANANYKRFLRNFRKFRQNLRILRGLMVMIWDCDVGESGSKPGWRFSSLIFSSFLED